MLELNERRSTAFPDSPDEGEGHGVRNIEGVNENLFPGLEVSGMGNEVDGELSEAWVHEREFWLRAS